MIQLQEGYELKAESEGIGYRLLYTLQVTMQAYPCKPVAFGQIGMPHFCEAEGVALTWRTSPDRQHLTPILIWYAILQANPFSN